MILAIFPLSFGEVSLCAKCRLEDRMVVCKKKHFKKQRLPKEAMIELCSLRIPPKNVMGRVKPWTPKRVSLLRGGDVQPVRGQR